MHNAAMYLGNPARYGPMTRSMCRDIERKKLKLAFVEPELYHLMGPHPIAVQTNVLSGDAEVCYVQRAQLGSPLLYQNLEKAAIYYDQAKFHALYNSPLYMEPRHYYKSFNLKMLEVYVRKVEFLCNELQAHRELAYEAEFVEQLSVMKPYIDRHEEVLRKKAASEMHANVLTGLIYEFSMNEALMCICSGMAQLSLDKMLNYLDEKGPAFIALSAAFPDDLFSQNFEQQTAVDFIERNADIDFSQLDEDCLDRFWGNLGALTSYQQCTLEKQEDRIFEQLGQKPGL